MLCMSILFVPHASAMTLDRGILHASLWSEDDVPMTCIEYLDPQFSTWIEVYLLKKGEVSPNMGIIEISGIYSVVGIQTIDVSNPVAYRLLRNGVTMLETDLYLGSCGVPVPGDQLYLTLGLTDPATYEETLFDPILMTMPGPGMVNWLPGSRLMDAMLEWMRILRP